MSPEELAEQDNDDLLWVLSQPQGRRFLRRIIDRWGRLDSQSYTGDRLSSDFNEGQRSIAIGLKRAIKAASLTLWGKLVNEGLDEEAVAVRRHVHGAPDAERDG